MTQLVYLINKRADLDWEGFRNACANYQALLDAHTDTLLIRDSYVQTHIATPCETCFSEARRLAHRSYDAQITVFWDTMDDYCAGAGSAQGIAAMDELAKAEKDFIDLGLSQAFFVDPVRPG